MVVVAAVPAMGTVVATGVVVATVAAAMGGAAASLAAVAQMVGFSCPPLPNKPATHFDGKNDHKLPQAVLAAAEAAGLSTI